MAPSGAFRPCGFAVALYTGYRGETRHGRSGVYWITHKNDSEHVIRGICRRGFVNFIGAALSRGGGTFDPGTRVLGRGPGVLGLRLDGFAELGSPPLPRRPPRPALPA